MEQLDSSNYCPTSVYGFPPGSPKRNRTLRGVRPTRAGRFPTTSRQRGVLSARSARQNPQTRSRSVHGHTAQPGIREEITFGLRAIAARKLREIAQGSRRDPERLRGPSAADGRGGGGIARGGTR